MAALTCSTVTCLPRIVVNSVRDPVSVGTRWQYAQTYLIDHQYGDWYEGGLDKQPEKKTALKGHIWKATYHQYRALSACVERLNKPAKH